MGTWNVQCANNGYAVSRIDRFSVPVFRFDARKGQKWPSDPDVKRRAELSHQTKQPLEVANWHSIATWVDPGQKFNCAHCFLTQCHDAAGSVYENIPAASLVGDKLHLVRFGSLSSPLAVIPYLRGQWNYMLFRYVPSATIGSLKFWFNGELKYDAPYNEIYTAPGPYWKFGAYMENEPMPDIVINVAWFGTGTDDLSDHAVNLPPII